MFFELMSGFHSLGFCPAGCRFDVLWWSCFSDILIGVRLFFNKSKKCGIIGAEAWPSG